MFKLDKCATRLYWGKTLCARSLWMASDPQTRRNYHMQKRQRETEIDIERERNRGKWAPLFFTNCSTAAEAIMQLTNKWISVSCCLSRSHISTDFIALVIKIIATTTQHTHTHTIKIQIRMHLGQCLCWFTAALAPVWPRDLSALNVQSLMLPYEYTT